MGASIVVTEDGPAGVPVSHRLSRFTAAPGRLRPVLRQGRMPDALGSRVRLEAAGDDGLDARPCRRREPWTLEGSGVPLTILTDADPGPAPPVNASQWYTTARGPPPEFAATADAAERATAAAASVAANRALPGFVQVLIQG